ncbi:ABC transporter permease [Enterococcus faecium]|nr:ABC transporter permease [Enterococcus faecium]
MSSFFQKRLARHQKKMMKYMRYVLNDHFVLVCLFLIGGVGLYYSNWLKTLQPPFAIGGLIISVFWMLCLFVGKMATFAEAADIVFLLPKEKEMQTYLERAFRYSCIFPLIFLILACGLAMPLVVVSTEQSFSMFFVYLIILWSLKFSHLQIKRAELFRLDQQVIRYWKLGWFFSSLIFLFLSFYWLIWAGIAGALVQASLYYWFLWKQQEKGLDWEKMVHVEEHRLHQIYQFINLFTDVPEITAKNKRRRYLDPILTHIKRESKNTYLYLFARRLARGSDFSGLYFRLVIIGGLLIAGVVDFYFSLIIGFLFLYLIGFQLLPLANQFRYMVLVQLYPIHKNQKKQAIQYLLTWVLIIASVIFGLIAAVVLDGQQRWVPLAAYLIVTMLFVKLYVPTRLKKMSD